MKKAFITGAAGFLAGHLIDALSLEGYEIIGLVKPSHNVERIKSQGVKVVRGFVTDPESYVDSIPEEALVFHCYALSSGAKESEEVYMRINGEGTRMLMEACEKKKISKLVHVSSVSVVGPREAGEGAVTEETEARPHNFYGKSKLKAEEYVKEFHFRTSVPVVILRLSTLYGPRAHKGAAFYRLFKMVAKFPVQALVDGGEHKYEFNFIKNVVHGIMLAKGSEKSFAIYNLGDIEKRKYKDVLKVMAKEINPATKLITVPSLLFQPFAKAGDYIGKVKGKRFKFDSQTLKSLKGSWATSYDKAIKELGFTQKYSLEEGVKETVEYMRKEKML